ncbi:NADH:flavin oxidoreductase/NADH oxidase [Mariniflexile litorale]|uniref:NADH:flavin oxidoreductase/NADH oxidase n=1 Tax=Mariniflexile litorale TaxID=3045158 RepID=A0AAU7ECE9_9FLAO|nr:NADH:flavin oxidoreductase/NADH oxidase [Mariniflexile sp. KMM 9835]MDQ8212338.1 NADH:flavin oxidoreductase/NADH oxidase [Mariniflexile sp. KMM 9835]
MSKLFSSLTIKDITFKNRIVQSPMCMYSAEDGLASDWHFVHYGTRAIGGAGTIMTEAAAVSPEGRISPGDLGIWSDKHIEGLKRITSFLKQNGSVAGIQLAHAGRKGSYEVHGADSTLMRTKEEGGWEVMAPSAIPFSDNALTPKAMTFQDMETIRQQFESATKRAVAAGFQLLEIHSAHGYLLHSFLSPISNKRDDDYGGSIENRSRLLLEVIETVQTVWPKNLPLAVRISATDWDESGWDSESSQWLAQQLEQAGVDIIDVSSGGTLPNVTIPVGPAYQLPLAKDIKAVVKTMKVGAVGMITNAEQAETILLNDDADLIYIGREFLRNPYFPLQAAQDLRAEPDVPKPYERAFPKRK